MDNLSFLPVPLRRVGFSGSRLGSGRGKRAAELLIVPVSRRPHHSLERTAPGWRQLDGPSYGRLELLLLITSPRRVGPVVDLLAKVVFDCGGDPLVVTVAAHQGQTGREHGSFIYCKRPGARELGAVPNIVTNTLTIDNKQPTLLSNI